jgi:hypothetical protein
MSMALRRPSLNRLKQIDTAKIMAPGSAATGRDHAPSAPGRDHTTEFWTMCARI